MNRFLSIVAVAILVPIVVVGGSFIITGCRFASNAATTTYNEFSPSALLAKYTEFKTMHSRLAALKATIETLERARETTVSAYGGDLSKMPRDVRQDLASSSQEIAGTKSGFNRLAADYNRNMSLFNYRFCNIGDLPKGATEVLPREYVSYIEH